jgi:small subunit ribosomal protein S4
MRRIRKKFKNPRIPWDRAEIEERDKIIKDYGLRRRKEVLIAEKILRDFRERARKLIAKRDEEESKALLSKLIKLGLLKPGQGLDDVLSLTINNILDRRLQTIIWKKGLANTPKHARQLIAHDHICINGRRIKFPSYLVPIKEEKKIGLYGK